jgi:hypothetical protein
VTDPHAVTCRPVPDLAIYTGDEADRVRVEGLAAALGSGDDAGVSLPDSYRSYSTLDGGDGDDELSGGSLRGGNGADRLTLSGEFSISAWGDAGDDVIVSGPDHAYITPGTGRDVVRAGEGDDNGFRGDDVIEGGAGDDTLMDGGDGDDRLAGGEGADVLTAGVGDDVADGGPGDDTIGGEDGADALFGGDGADTLNGGPGVDVLDGAAGDDRLEAWRDRFRDRADCGEGADQAWLEAGVDRAGASCERLTTTRVTSLFAAHLAEHGRRVRVTRDLAVVLLPCNNPFGSLTVEIRRLGRVIGRRGLECNAPNVNAYHLIDYVAPTGIVLPRRVVRARRPLRVTVVIRPPDGSVPTREPAVLR